MESTCQSRAAFLPPSLLVARSSGAKRRDFPFIKRILRIGAIPCACINASINPAKQYIPLHVHSDFSLLDSASQLPTLVGRAVELDASALALINHGVPYGAIQLVRQCAGTNVKPIIGNEMYIVNDVPRIPPDPGVPSHYPYHLILLAKKTQGYRNLVKLMTVAHLDGRVANEFFRALALTKPNCFKSARFFLCPVRAWEGRSLRQF